MFRTVSSLDLRRLALALALLLPAWLQAETLQYGVEWRLVRAGTATLKAGQNSGELGLLSTGIVSKLVFINDLYRSQTDPQGCISNISLDVHEGKKQRVLEAHREGSALRYTEKDKTNGKVLETKSLPAPDCFGDVVTGLKWLRTSNLKLGQSTQRWMTDGRKIAHVKVEAQELERVKTPLGTFDTIRYEVHVMNDVLFRRNGRVFVYVTNDERRLPVQIKVRMAFYIGTVTLSLEKIEA